MKEKIEISEKNEEEKMGSMGARGPGWFLGGTGVSES